jgi:hypothetical protein
VSSSHQNKKPILKSTIHAKGTIARGRAKPSVPLPSYSLSHKIASFVFRGRQKRQHDQNAKMMLVRVWDDENPSRRKKDPLSILEPVLFLGFDTTVEESEE